MALKIRLRQQGRKNRRSYRLVVADSRLPRDGKYVEKVGFYDPHLESGKDVTVDQERLLHWLSQGAELTEKARSLVARAAPTMYKEWTHKLSVKKQKPQAKKKTS